jgi:hypothetical protein
VRQQIAATVQEASLVLIAISYESRISMKVIDEIVQGSHLDITVTVTNTATEPASATFFIRHSSEQTATSYSYDGGATPFVTKPVPGTYQISVPVEMAGTWYWDFALVWDAPAYSKVITGRSNVMKTLATG